MFIIGYKGSIYNDYFIGFETEENGRKSAMFTTDKKDWRIKKYKTRAGCEKAFNDIVKYSKNLAAGIEILEIND